MMSSVQQQIQLQDVNFDDTTACPGSSHPYQVYQLQCNTEPHHVVAMLLMHAVEPG